MPANGFSKAFGTSQPLFLFLAVAKTEPSPEESVTVQMTPEHMAEVHTAAERLFIEHALPESKKSRTDPKDEPMQDFLAALSAMEIEWMELDHLSSPR